jgi:hypothetical protein
VHAAIRRCCLVLADCRGSSSSENNGNGYDANCADVNVGKQLRVLVAASLSRSAWLGEWKLSMMDAMGAMDAISSST